MKLKKPQKAINNLKVGKFIKCNGSTLYVFKSSAKTSFWPSLEGVLIIERHPEISLYWNDLKSYTFIPKPKKKHVDNAIKQIRETLKFKSIDNLTYVENLDILKNYLKSDIVGKE